MNCSACLKFMDAYIDGELQPSMMLEVDEHLTQCSDCSSLYKFKNILKDSLKKIEKIKAPAHLRAKIEASAHEKSPYLKLQIILPVAAAAVMMFAVWNHRIKTDSSETMNGMLSDVVEHHVRELPMEIKDANATKAAGWFHGKVDFPVHPLGGGVKNVSFEGARVSNVREHAAAEMSYLVDGKKVTFMTFPSKPLSLDSPDIKVVNGVKYITGEKNGYNVVMTQHGNLVYAVSSQLSHKKLISLLSNRI
ncbi:MAG: zf-HC2 domain-containing protein [Deltaproteobacteria bacterium]|nr:zf-HC2 domain-containing protein [Deltaproteobacteria bacterium]